jgi:hypothetical protein
VKSAFGIALALALTATACRSAQEQDPRWTVQVTIDAGPRGGARSAAARVPPGATALDATLAVARVQQARVCCSDEDVWAIDGLESDPSRCGYWSWWLDGELGPGLAHQVVVHDGARVEWRFSVADPAPAP